MIYAVFTGDLVESSALDQGQLTVSLQGIKTCLQAIWRWEDSPPLGFGIRGGDGWQAALPAPHRALRAALYLRAQMLELPAQSRFALSIAEGTLPPDGDTNRAHGPAFTTSGRLLEALPKHRLMAVSGPGPGAATFALADHIASGWTQAQARALAPMLAPDPGPRSEVAKRLGISRQAVDQALNSAGFRALSDALDAWENT